MSDAPTTKQSSLLVQRPAGEVDVSCFSLVERAVDELHDGDVLVKNLYLSCDPYLRLRMEQDFVLGAPVVARALGQVVTSKSPRFSPGDFVWGFLGWETYSTTRADNLFAVDPELGPLSHALSVRGMIGLTAWIGIYDIIQPTPGDTVVVSAGAGAVGSVAGQLARLAGARAIAIVGGPDKARHAIDFLGYDAAIDYKAPGSLRDALALACPQGISGYFDNVGGAVLNAVIDNLAPGARLAMCGNISSYNSDAEPPGIALHRMLGTGGTMKWFSINDHMDRVAAFPARVAPLVASGRLAYHEHIGEGIENVPQAFLGLFRGENLGKRLVKIADFA